jgi:hypothetical protein
MQPEMDTARRCHSQKWQMANGAWQIEVAHSREQLAPAALILMDRSTHSTEQNLVLNHS